MDIEMTRNTFLSSLEAVLCSVMAVLSSIVTMVCFGVAFYQKVFKAEIPASKGLTIDG